MNGTVPPMRRLFAIPKLLALFVPLLVLTDAGRAAVAGQEAGQEPAWTIVLHAKGYVIGDSLKRLQTRRAWVADFDDRLGGFEIAVRKTAVAIPAPQYRMDYLILKIPFYYPETPIQASVAERRKVYDAFVSAQAKDRSVVTARVEALLQSVFCFSVVGAGIDALAAQQLLELFFETRLGGACRPRRQIIALDCGGEFRRLAEEPARFFLFEAGKPRRLQIGGRRSMR
jgi:hypothetical protein